MSERVVILTTDTQEDYERRQAFKKGLRQRGTDEQPPDDMADELRMDTKAGREKQSKIKKAALAAAEAKLPAEKRAGDLPEKQVVTPLKKAA